MKRLWSITDLTAEGYSAGWLREIARSKDFITAGGMRRPVHKSKIFFDKEKLDQYLKNQTQKTILKEEDK